MAKESPVSVKNQNKKQTQLNYLLGTVAIASLCLGVWQIKNAIIVPFGTGNGTQSTQTSTNKEDLALQNKDTDGDSISDYDEINVYKTSPYLKDSDSDGIDDKTEIEKGTDPNCPEGKKCGEVLTAVTGDGTGNNTAVTNVDVTPAQIREMLKKNGLSDEVIAKYDDASLLKMYQEVAGEVSPVDSNKAASEPTTPNLTLEQKQKILALPVADLRKYLLDSGAEPDVLQKMDDAMLKTLVKQVLGL